MKIKTLGDFRKATNNLENDFILEVNLYELIPEEELTHMRYPFPYKRADLDLEINDVGYSDRVVCFGVYKK